jgi:EAL domain-containing protein (putative c-di-GMP-specific phosphodiesterase class I)
MTLLELDSSSTRRNTAESASSGWLLEGCLPNQSSLTRTPLKSFPFRVGRDSSCDLQIASRNVSKSHAVLLHTPLAVIVKDLGSTNGTFINGRRIAEPTPVDERDLIQLADVELRLVREQVAAADFTNVGCQPEQSWSFSRMHEVLNEGRMTIHFQPIVGADRSMFGYEALVRTDVPGLESPLALFSMAARLGLEERLSTLCRTEAVRVLDASGIPGALFLNTHANEYLGAELVESMRELRERAGNRLLVLEVHEEAVPEVKSFREFAAALRDLDVRLAFDDFGAGQSRLLELSQVLPDYLKFDRSLVKDLGSDAAHAGLVSSLHKSATALGITTLAEGLETPESIAACQELGFTLFQGFAFGRPQPIDQCVATHDRR